MVRNILAAIGAGLLLLSGWAPAQTPGAGEVIPHYKHTIFTEEDGAPDTVIAITQTPDGFLWIGGYRGLYRYDGIKFEPINLPASLPLRSDGITALHADKKGGMWIGHDWGGITLYRDGHFFDKNVGRPYSSVLKFGEDGDGNIWALSIGARFASIGVFVRGRWRNYGFAPGMLAEQVSNMLVASDGSLWLASWGNLLHSAPGAPRFKTVGTISPMASLVERSDNSVWILDKSGLRRAWDGVPGHPPRLEAPVANFEAAGNAFSSSRASDGALWLGISGNSLAKVSGRGGRSKPQVDRLAARYLSAPTINTVFVDREDGIWVGSDVGLDWFKPVTINEVMPAKEQSNTKLLYLSAPTVAGSKGGDVLALVRGKYFRISGDGKFNHLQNLDNIDNVPCLSSSGTMWNRTDDALVSIEPRAERRVPLPEKIRSNVYQVCLLDDDNGWWVGGEGGFFHRRDGRWEQVILKKNIVVPPATMAVDDRGRFFGYMGRGSLYLVDRGRIDEIWPEKDMSLGVITVMVPTGDRMLIGGSYGLASYDASGIAVLPRSRYPFLAEIMGLAVSPAGVTWILSRQGLLRIGTDELRAAFRHPGTELHPTIFGLSDGLGGMGFEPRWTSLAIDRLGRLWAATNRGIYMLDPAHLRGPPGPPPVTIKSLRAKDRTWSATSPLALPKGTSNLVIDYTAPSFVNPQRIRFRYRLIGWDARWVDPGERRQAIYTNLSPGDYRFQVIAANENGPWNTTGATLAFTIPPTFLQSWAFKLLCIAAAIVLLVILYRLRLRQMAAKLRHQHNVETAERERIARELHDTLLQGFHGLILRFQSVANRLAPDNDLRRSVDEALDRGEVALVQARRRVVALRDASTDVDLAQALSSIAGRHGEPSTAAITFTVRGDPRPLDNLVYDELLRIGEEAIRNATLHAEASLIEVSVTYGDDLTLTVGDDGIGLPKEIALAGQRAGHFGLVGMRERATRVGGSVALKSRHGHGTEITVSVPGARAYRKSGWRRGAPSARAAG